jgi:hypothetical protein
VFTLKKPKAGHIQFWDADPHGRGLSVMVSDEGTRTYRSTFKRGDEWISRKLGRVGELTVKEAQTHTQKDRSITGLGIDPRGLSPSERQDALDGISPEESGRRAEAKRKAETTFEAINDYRFEDLLKSLDICLGSLHIASYRATTDAIYLFSAIRRALMLSNVPTRW